MTRPIPEDQLRGWLDKRLPSRERIDKLYGAALLLAGAGYPEDAETVEWAADLLLTVRQAVRGGRKWPSGGRKWPYDAPDAFAVWGQDESV